MTAVNHLIDKETRELREAMQEQKIQKDREMQNGSSQVSNVSGSRAFPLSLLHAFMNKVLFTFHGWMEGLCVFSRLPEVLKEAKGKEVTVGKKKETMFFSLEPITNLSRENPCTFPKKPLCNWGFSASAIQDFGTRPYIYYVCRSLWDDTDFLPPS